MSEREDGTMMQTRKTASNAAGVRAELSHGGGDDLWTVRLEGPGVTSRTAFDTDGDYARSLFAGMCLRYELAREVDAPKIENAAPAVAPRARAPRTDEKLSDKQRDVMAEVVRGGLHFVKRGGRGVPYRELTATQLRSLDRMGLITLSRSRDGLDGGWLNGRAVRVLVEHDERAAHAERIERIAAGR